MVCGGHYCAFYQCGCFFQTFIVYLIDSSCGEVLDQRHGGYVACWCLLGLASTCENSLRYLRHSARQCLLLSNSRLDIHTLTIGDPWNNRCFHFTTYSTRKYFRTQHVRLCSSIRLSSFEHMGYVANWIQDLVIYFMIYQK